MGRQIVFVNQSSGYLMIDIVRSLAKDYDEVVLLAGTINKRSRDLPDHVKVIPLTPYKRGSAFQRIYTWTLAFIKAWWVIATRYRHAELFLVSNPPFTLFLPRLVRNPYRLLLYDIYPDALKEYKVLSPDSWLYGLWARNNRIVFAGAKRIFTISEGMQTLVARYCDGQKTEIVPLWSEDPGSEHIQKEDNKFLLENGIGAKFVVMYSGNFGKTHPVELLIEVALRTSDPEILFVFIGGGAKYEAFREELKRRKLNNCLLLPWQSQDMLRYSIPAADLSFVLLGPEAENLSVPSKVFSLFNAGVPIIAISGRDSALGKMVRMHEAGVVYSGDEIEEVVAFIARIKEDSVARRTLAGNSRKAAEHYTPVNAEKMR
jgi:hypothetical protein